MKAKVINTSENELTLLCPSHGYEIGQEVIMRVAIYMTILVACFVMVLLLDGFKDRDIVEQIGNSIILLIIILLIVVWVII